MSGTTSAAGYQQGRLSANQVSSDNEADTNFKISMSYKNAGLGICDIASQSNFKSTEADYEIHMEIPLPLLPQKMAGQRKLACNNRLMN